MRRARVFLWAKAAVSGLEWCVRVAAGFIGAIALISVLGVLDVPPWAPTIAMTLAGLTGIGAILRRAPTGRDAADLVDQWTGCPDLARTCVALPATHGAHDLVAAQAEMSAQRLPVALAWPAFPMRRVAFPLTVILAGFLVMPGAQDRPSAGTAAAMQVAERETPAQDEPTAISESTDVAAPDATASPDGAEESRPSLLNVLAEELDAPSLEVETSVDGDRTLAASGRATDGDGQGMASASLNHTSSRIETPGPGPATLRLTAMASDKGRAPLPAGDASPPEPSAARFVAIGDREGLHVARWTGLAHADRALARRYLEERSGLR